MPVSMTRAAVVGLTLLAAPMAQAATLDGTTLSAEYFYPDLDASYPSASPNPTGPLVVGPGLDAGLNVEGVTTISLDFSGNALTVLFSTILSSPTWNDATFNGLVITLLSPGNFTAFAQTGGTAIKAISFDADSLFINWAGLSYDSATQLTFDIGYETAPVPLPAGLPLLALALGGLAVLGRRRAA